jgi:hypothetical protein
MPSTRSKIIWICAVLLVAAVHAFASCATREQRALIHELELVASALFFAVVLVQNKVKFGVYLPGLKKKDKPRVTTRRSIAL